jgi:hypothetical protein
LPRIEHSYNSMNHRKPEKPALRQLVLKNKFII